MQSPLQEDAICEVAGYERPYQGIFYSTCPYCAELPPAVYYK